MNDFVSLSTDFTTPHFSADLPRRSEEKYAGDYEIEEDTEHINRGGNKGTGGNDGIIICVAFPSYFSIC